MNKLGVALLLGMVVLVSGWLLTSCGPAARTQEGVVDVWATWGDDADQFQALLDRHSQSSGIPVRIATRVRSGDLLGALAGGEGPDLVVLSSNDLVAAYHAQGLVEPLDGWIEATGIELEEFYPAPLAACKGPGGTTLCLPWGSDVEVLFWNKDLFAAAGLDADRPPQTMEELVDFARQLTLRDEEGQLTQAGFIPDFPGPHTGLYAGMFGDALYSDRGAGVALNSQPVVDALEWQKQFYDAYTQENLKDLIPSFKPAAASRHAMYAGRRLDCRQCHRATPVDDKRAPVAAFYDGQIAMMVSGQWQAELSALSSESPRVNYGLAPFPPPAAHPEWANNAVLQGPVVFVPAAAMDKEAAARLLAWMMSPEIAAEAASANSLLPASRIAAQEARFRQMPEFQMFLALMAQPNAMPVVTTPGRQALNEALGQVEVEVLHKGGDPVTLLDKVQTELSSRLREGLSYRDGP